VASCGCEQFVGLSVRLALGFDTTEQTGLHSASGLILQMAGEL
jgi:hypothetical protein